MRKFVSCKTKNIVTFTSSYWVLPEALLFKKMYLWSLFESRTDALVEENVSRHELSQHWSNKKRVSEDDQNSSQLNQK